LRTYLRTILLLLTSGVLFGTALIAYTSFYYAYIPVRGLEVPIYLQYEHRAPVPIPPIGSQLEARVPKHPYGLANIHGLVSRQKYDIDVSLTLPRSRKNLDAGNFMILLDMRGPGTRGRGVKAALGWEEDWEVEDFSQGPDSGTTKEGISRQEAETGGVEKAETLARSRRPAILTYRSWMTEMAYRGLRLPLYVLGWGSEEELIKVRLMEGVIFERGWRNVPTSVRLELRSDIPLQVYSVGVKFVARLEGLRWVMYTHRLTSAAAFIALFWGVEMGVLLFTWALFSFCLGRVDDEEDSLKAEAKEGAMKTEAEKDNQSVPQTPFSDTESTFPTLSSHQPLHYSPTSPKEERVTPALEDIPVKEEAEADDEDDDFLLEEPIPNSATGILTDSGIGTSMDSSIERRGLNRRKSQK
jgi:hypothetical protein